MRYTSWLLLLAAPLAVAACTLPEPQLEPFEPGRYGLASCEDRSIEQCRRIAGRTFLSFGPKQVEYHSPDGHTRIWVGDRMYSGYWSAGKGGLFGPVLCYKYASPGASNCDGNLRKGDTPHPDAVRDGDPFDLQNRQAAPFDLGSVGWRAGLGEIEQRYRQIVTRQSGTDVRGGS